LSLSLLFTAFIPFSPLALKLLVSMGSSEYVPPNSFQCDGVSWWLHAGMVPVHRVAMDTSLPGMNLLTLPIPTFIAGHKLYGQ